MKGVMINFLDEGNLRRRYMYSGMDIGRTLTFYFAPIEPRPALACPWPRRRQAEK